MILQVGDLLTNHGVFHPGIRDPLPSILQTLKGTAKALPETNSKFAPEPGWLGDDPFNLGFCLFSGANC